VLSTNSIGNPELIARRQLTISKPFIYRICEVAAFKQGPFVRTLNNEIISIRGLIKGPERHINKTEGSLEKREPSV
jgi:hypothetical protein